MYVRHITGTKANRSAEKQVTESSTRMLRSLRTAWLCEAVPNPPNEKEREKITEQDSVPHTYGLNTMTLQHICMVYHFISLNLFTRSLGMIVADILVHEKTSKNMQILSQISLLSIHQTKFSWVSCVRKGETKGQVSCCYFWALKVQIDSENCRSLKKKKPHKIIKCMK